MQGAVMRLERDDGASAVEFALIAPLLILLLFGIIEFGIGFFQQQSAAAAAREAARRAAVAQVTCNATTDETDLFYIVRHAAEGAALKSASLAVDDDNEDGTKGDVGDNVTVTVKYDVDLSVVSALIPPLQSTLSGLTQTGVARIEQPGGVATCTRSF
jgi:Flp pilus assembly protein TadG